MNVLSIGNSFSQDAQRYLHQIAAAGGTKINCFNLYIGGCCLSEHYQNMLSGEREYSLEMNGVSTGFYVSLKEALLNRTWDVVTVQQASFSSPEYDAYQPYLNELMAYIRKCVPKARVLIHQTWAYEEGSPRLMVNRGYETHAAMLSDVVAAYSLALKDSKADGLIPAGEVFGELNAARVEKIHRDTFHASFGLGRYALGLIWYKALTGKNITENSFSQLDEEISAEDMAFVKECVNKVADKYGI